MTGYSGRVTVGRGRTIHAARWDYQHLPNGWQLLCGVRWGSADPIRTKAGRVAVTCSTCTRRLAKQVQP